MEKKAAIVVAKWDNQFAVYHQVFFDQIFVLTGHGENRDAHCY